MAISSSDIAAQTAELKRAPVRVKWVAGYGALLGFIVLLGFCASAFVGYVGWGKAIGYGIIQFLLLWFVSFSVLARHRWAWWFLLALLLLRLWGGLGHALRMLRVTIEGGLADHGRNILFDAVGVVQLVVCGILLWLLFSKDVRNYVHRPAS
jgi:hypothetical protein